MIKNLVTYVYDRLRALAALFIRFYPAWLNKLLPADKALHLAFGFTLAMVPALFGYPVFGLLLACSAGARASGPPESLLMRMLHCRSVQRGD